MGKYENVGVKKKKEKKKKKKKRRKFGKSE